MTCDVSVSYIRNTLRYSMSAVIETHVLFRDNEQNFRLPLIIRAITT